MKLVFLSILILFAYTSLANQDCLDLLDQADSKNINTCQSFFEEEEKLCQLGRGLSCYSLARYFSLKKEDAESYYASACQAKIPDACFALDKIKYKKSNRRFPITLHESHCELGSNLACLDALQGHARAKNLEKTLLYLKKSCYLRHFESCEITSLLKKPNSKPSEILLKIARGLSPIEEKTKCDTEPLAPIIEKEKNNFLKFLIYLLNLKDTKLNPQKLFGDIKIIKESETIIKKEDEYLSSNEKISSTTRKLILKIESRPKLYGQKLSSKKPLSAFPIEQGFAILRLQGLNDCSLQMDDLYTNYLLASSQVYAKLIEQSLKNTNILKTIENLDDFLLIDIKEFNLIETKIQKPVKSIPQQTITQILSKINDRSYYIEERNKNILRIAHIINQEKLLIFRFKLN